MTIHRQATGNDTLGEVGEVAALLRIFPRLPTATAELLGPGDDAAVLAAPDKRMVITTDMMIHGPDFRLAWSTPYDLGWKAAASNLSDIAAMGAVPTGLVVAIAAPNDTPVSSLEAIADGLRDGCNTLAPGSGVIGGDLSVSTVLTIVVTAFGDLEGRAPIMRSGATIGDTVAVCGTLGLAANGLKLLFTEGSIDGQPDAAAAASAADRHPDAITAQLRPTPPIAAGKAAALGGATAMLDLSDGLAIDARRIATASGVAIDLSAQAVGGRVQLDGGEDHSLLATFAASAELPAGFRAIGRVVAGEGLLVDGVPYTARGGWDPYADWDGAAG
ncbi:MAG: thiamine-phosphate kinase [Rhodoglobus sp.]